MACELHSCERRNLAAMIFLSSSSPGQSALQTKSSGLLLHVCWNAALPADPNHCPEVLTDNQVFGRMVKPIGPTSLQWLLSSTYLGGTFGLMNPHRLPSKPLSSGVNTTPLTARQMCLYGQLPPVTNFWLPASKRPVAGEHPRSARNARLRKASSYHMGHQARLGRQCCRNQVLL
jgi:hypothetical protein